MEQEIKILNITLAAEAVAVAQKNSWGAWLLSAIYKRAEDSEEEKARKDRGIQERRIEKDMKERWLEFRKVSLKNEEDLLRRTKEEVDAADLCDNKEIQRLRDVMRAREQMERQEKERIERERLAKIWKEHQEQREREEAERFRKTPADIYAREQTQRRKESNGQKYTNFDFGNKGNGANRTSSCKHQGWWHKVQGRAACPKCYRIWTYLLRCPSCQVNACPNCLPKIRKSMRGTAMNPENPQRERSRRSFYDYEGYDY